MGTLGDKENIVSDERKVECNSLLSDHRLSSDRRSREKELMLWTKIIHEGYHKNTPYVSISHVTRATYISLGVNKCRATHILLEVSKRRATHILFGMSKCRAAHTLFTVNRYRVVCHQLYKYVRCIYLRASCSITVCYLIIWS